MNSYLYLEDFISSYLNVEFDCTIEEYQQSIKRWIDFGDLDINLLRDDIELAIKDPDFNWRQLAVEHGLIYSYLKIDPEIEKKLSHTDVLNYIKILIWDILYPKFALNSLQKEYLSRTIYLFLRENAIYGQWVDVNTLILELQKLCAKWPFLELYHIKAIEPYSTEGLIEVRRNSIIGEIFSHVRIYPESNTDKYLEDLIQDSIEPFCLLKKIKWPIDCGDFELLANF